MKTSQGLYFSRLLAALVDLVEESLKDGLLKPLVLVNLGDAVLDLADDLLLVGVVLVLEVELVVELLDLGDVGLVLLAVVVLEDLALLGRGDLEGLVDEPRALVVLDVGAVLANDVLGAEEAVEEVVLDLEVLSHGDQDVLGLLEVLGRGNVQVVQGQGDRQVEAVVGRLVDDNVRVLLQAVVVQVGASLGGRQQVTQLADLGLPRGLVEELDHVNVGRVGTEVLLQQDVDGRLEHEGVVDGDHADVLLAVPAGLASAGDAAVHDVVGHEEEGLEQLNQPAEDGRRLVLLAGQFPVEELLGRVGHGHSTVAFSTQSVCSQGL